MKAFLMQTEAALRGVGGDTQSVGILLRQWVMTISVFGFCYGAAMGSFSCVRPERIAQVVFAGVKVPLLLLCTFMLSLPSFFVFNNLMGLREDFSKALRLIVSAQSGLTIVLASLAPLSLLWNFSTVNHTATVLFNAVLFGIALGASQIILRRHYRPLIEKDARHRVLLRAWGVLFAFTGIQLAWVLRPFVANIDRPVSFFREEAWGNAYIIVFQMIGKIFGR